MAAFAFLATVALAVTAIVRKLTRSDREKATAFLKEGIEKECRARGVPFTLRVASWDRVEVSCGEFSLNVSIGIEGVDEAQHREYRNVLRVTLGGENLPRTLRFSRERGWGDDVLTGDSRFDDAVDVRGEPSIVLARFDKRLRDSVRQFVSLGGSLNEGQLEVVGLPVLSYYEIPHVVRLTLDVASLLSSIDGGSIWERLARNAAVDPEPGVRLWTLLQLQEQFGLTPEAGKASRAGLGDTSPWVRLSAARFLTDEGLEVLRTLAQDRQVPDDAASEAVALLAARLPKVEAGPLLLGVLKHRAGESRRQAVEQLGLLKHLAAVGPLIVVLERSNPRTAAAAATALGLLGDSSAEPSLLKAVSDDARELRLAAARALGAVGTVRAVEPLLALVENKRLDAENRQSVREAVSAIQSRLAGAGAGQLSMASEPTESGRLSLATPTAGPGDLSFVPSPK